MNGEVNIFSASKNLAAILLGMEHPSGLKVNVRTIKPGNSHVPSGGGVNVLIVKNLPEIPAPGAKYILCTKSPELLTAQSLEKIYGLWPEPLTPSLVRFLAGNLLERLKSELETTTEAIEHQKRITEMARQDYLTGLATRWYLNEYIMKNQAERNVTCIYFDLDHFKQVNDTYGHQAGDRALAATAEMMQQDFTDGFCARMGGDEFMIVLLGQREALDVERKVEGFMAALLEYYAGTKTMRALSVSAGVAQKVHGDEKTIDRLIRESDIALYEAKKSGRACCKVYTPEMENSRNDNEAVRSYYLVDYENVKSSGLNGIHRLDDSCNVCIFYSRNADRISTELNLHLKESRANITYHHVEVGQKNALDFQLSSYLGELITENSGTEAKYFIVSKDNGFTSLISFWKGKNITVEILADVSGTKSTQDTEDMAGKIAELTGETEDATKIAGIITSSRTKTEINTALLKTYKDSSRAGEIYRAIKPLLQHKRGH